MTIPRGNSSGLGLVLACDAERFDRQLRIKMEMKRRHMRCLTLKIPTISNPLLSNCVILHITLRVNANKNFALQSTMSNIPLTAYY